LINFFATPQELTSWMGEWVTRHHLFHLVTQGNNIQDACSDVPWERSADAMPIVENGDSILLSPEPISTNTAGTNRLSELNPGLLYITLPKLRPEGLHPGLFGTGTNDPQRLIVWRRIGRAFLDRTEAGLWGTYPTIVEGKAIFKADYRYTAGAAALWRTGVPLLGAGVAHYHIVKPVSSVSPESEEEGRTE
jgi:hypothetical protein